MRRGFFLGSVTPPILSMLIQFDLEWLNILGMITRVWGGMFLMGQPYCNLLGTSYMFAHSITFLLIKVSSEMSHVWSTGIRLFIWQDHWWELRVDINQLTVECYQLTHQTENIGISTRISLLQWWMSSSAFCITGCSCRWQFSVAVTRWSRSTQLLYIEPS